MLFAVILLVTKFVQAHFPPSLRGRRLGKAFVLAGPTLGKPLAVATAATLVLGLAAAFFL